MVISCEDSRRREREGGKRDGRIRGIIRGKKIEKEYLFHPPEWGGYNRRIEYIYIYISYFKEETAEQK